MAINDPELGLFASIAAAIHQDFAIGAADPWKDSPFGWIKGRPSRQVGAIGEKLVERWCAAKGFDVAAAPNSDADRVIHGYLVEVKFSTLWASGGYKFQQIRDQDYEYLFCLGVSPFEVHAWLVPKPVLYDYVIGHTGQHTGATGTETAWLGFPAASPPPWLRPYGGTLSGRGDLTGPRSRPPLASDSDILGVPRRNWIAGVIARCVRVHHGAREVG